MKIIDGFSFYNEFDMLEYRLNVLKDVVDFFVIVESPLTHAGNSKPYFYNENKDRFAEFHSKIIHVMAAENIPLGKGGWEREAWQRNQIKQGIARLSLDDTDLILISDCDEIFNPNTIRKIRMDDMKIDVLNMRQDMYYYNIESFMTKDWTLPKILSYKSYLNHNCDASHIRSNLTVPSIHNAGWHLSFFGNEDFISNKIKNFACQEFNSNHYTDTDLIKNRVAKKEDLFGRRECKLVKIPISKNTFPPCKLDLLLELFPLD